VAGPADCGDPAASPSWAAVVMGGMDTTSFYQREPAHVSTVPTVTVTQVVRFAGPQISRNSMLLAHADFLPDVVS